VKARRVYPDENGYMHFEEGDYGRDSKGEWWARAPGMKVGASLADHAIIENSDGTISASPSIEAPDFHGHLLSDVWYVGSWAGDYERKREERK